MVPITDQLTAAERNLSALRAEIDRLLDSGTDYAFIGIGLLIAGYLLGNVFPFCV